MGTLCDRCGTVNRYEDHYCGVCGAALISSLKHETKGAPASLTKSEPDSRQYTSEEIEELLALRRAMKKDEPTTKILGQDDIDQLFG